MKFDKSHKRRPGEYAADHYDRIVAMGYDRLSDEKPWQTYRRIVDMGYELQIAHIDRQLEGWKRKPKPKPKPKRTLYVWFLELFKRKKK